MKFVVSILLLTFLSLSYADDADELAKCKCWDGYTPTKDKEDVKCHGILLLDVLPCNVPERPKCECSGSVTGILLDGDGMWCSDNNNEKERKKWACENKAEWDKFYEENPREKP